MRDGGKDESARGAGSTAGALVALFATAIAAGYRSADLWQMALLLALLTGLVVWIGKA